MSEALKELGVCCSFSGQYRGKRSGNDNKERGRVLTCIQALCTQCVGETHSLSLRSCRSVMSSSPRGGFDDNKMAKEMLKKKKGAKKPLDF